MINYLVRTPTGYAFPEDPDIHNKIKVAAMPEGDVWNIAWDNDPVSTLPIVDGLLIGAWNQDGSIADSTAVDPYYYVVRPLGNDPDGLATVQLRYTHPSGWSQVNLRSDGLYPADNDAMTLEMRHKYFDVPANPQATGWGFRVEILHVDEQREPTNRGIGVYRDAECSDYFYTTGAFQFGPSEWQTDDQGEPLDVYFTDSWDGNRLPTKIDNHLALLFGSAQEGHQTLYEAEDASVYNYWKADLGEAQKQAFIDLLATRNIEVQPISFNRIIVKPNGLTLTMTWAQIIHGKVVGPHLWVAVIIHVAEEVGLRTPSAVI